jgi:hypothetical protein
MDLIFKRCESPIERGLFAALVCNFLMASPGCIYFEIAPKTDIENHINLIRSRSEASFLPYLFYKKLPLDARPSKYEEFLDATSAGELTTDGGIDYLKQTGLIEYDLCAYYAFHVCLQPKFDKFFRDGIGAARADALIWVPANPTVRVIVECDGFDYHQDKKAFNLDRKRDRRFTEKGYTVRRYSGSEIVGGPVSSGVDLYNFLVEKYEYGYEYAERWKLDYEKRNVDQLTPSPEVLDSWRSWRTQQEANA